VARAARVVVHHDAHAAAVATAADLAQHLRAAVAARGVARVAFSGGGSAPPMLQALTGEDVPWADVHVYQVDERVAPDGDPDRNATALRGSLLDRVAIREANVHLLPVTADDLGAAALACGATLPRFDVLHMGIGPDGHTASWPPDDPVIAERVHAVAVVGPFNGRLRLTITPPVVDDARAVIFLVTGADKRAPLARMLAGDPATPASHVPLERTVVHADPAAFPSGE
jgi:6-phosphogluconolactonase